MDFSEEELKIQQEACEYMAAHKDELIEKFITSKRPLRIGFGTLFMAGSPGAGKTEFSQRFIPLTFDRKDKDMVDFFVKQKINMNDIGALMVRIDVDEIRTFLPQYQKTDEGKGTIGNAHVIQKAANKGLDILRKYCLTNDIPFLHDGTFGNYETMKRLVQESLKRGRAVRIYYLYLDPLKAWEFTKAREYMEGRNIVKEKFIDQYFNSKANVDRVKAEFGKKVTVTCVLKNSDNKVQDIEMNINSIDTYLKTMYKKGSIKEYSRAELEENLV